MQNKSNDSTIIIPPFWPLIGILLTFTTFSAAMYFLGIESSFPLTPSTTLICSGILVIFLAWRRFEFSNDGIVYTHCGIYRKEVSWNNIMQIIEVQLDRNANQLSVILIVLDSIPDKRTFSSCDNVRKFILNYWRHIFVVYCANEDRKKKLYDFLQCRWGCFEWNINIHE